MSMVIKSKQILAATLVVALAAAVTVNWYYRKSAGVLSEGETTELEQLSGNLGDSLYVAGTVKAEESTSAKGDENETTTKETLNDPQEYFSEAKLKRTNAHDNIIDSIEDILENDELTKENKDKINMLLSDFKSDIKSETDAENLIKAKTGSECLVTINNDTCQVILEKNTLNDRLILQITEIIEKNTNISAENLTIIELK